VHFAGFLKEESQGDSGYDADFDPYGGEAAA
jgi:hypothetical protein